MAKVIFLDRDGVINHDPDTYVTSWDNFKFLDGALDAIKKLTDYGFDIIIVSNQAGIAKGLYSRHDLTKITKEMNRVIESHGGKIFNAYYCPHKKEDNCACRKPKSGLLIMAENDYKLKRKSPVDVKNSYMIGDKIGDIQAGKEFGLKTIFVRSGKVEYQNESQWPVRPDFIAQDLYAAVTEIVLGNKHKLKET